MIYRLFIKYLRKYYLRLKTSLKWILFSVLSGIIIGLAGTAFYFCMNYASDLRGAFPWLIFLLPAGGLAIVGLYHLFQNQKDPGTNLVLSAVHSGDHIPIRMAPLIFASTVLTHLFGGSAGREGAALQIGGSLGNGIGRLFHFNEKEQKVLIMCGMSAAFSAVFGTPLAAAVFSMEVISVGIMHYSAILPCVISSLIAHQIASCFGAVGEHFVIQSIPDFALIPALKISLLAVLCAIISILFCVMLHGFSDLFRKLFQNGYVRILTGGFIVLALTLLIGSQDYNGTGIPFIEQCFSGTVPPYAFLLKMILTAVTLAAGYKGGEIVPSFFVGAAFGCFFGNIIDLSPSLCAAAGMGAVFCGVTNSPITSLLICFELFGFEGMPYYLLSIALSYVLSGYYGLYQSQKIIYSKYKNQYINRKTR